MSRGGSLTIYGPNGHIQSLRAAADQGFHHGKHRDERKTRIPASQHFVTVPSVLYACGAPPPPPHALARRLRASLGPQALLFRDVRGHAFNARRQVAIALVG